MSTGMAFDWLSMTFFNHCLIKVLGLSCSFFHYITCFMHCFLTAFLLANNNGEFTSCILSRVLARVYLVFGKKVSFLLMFTPRSFRARSIDRIPE